MMKNRIERLLAESLVGDEDDEAAWDAVRQLHNIGSREVLDYAITWSKSLNPKERSRSADILAQLGRGSGNPDHSFPAESFDALATLLRSERDPQVVRAAVSALGHFYEQRAVAIVLPYCDHPDAGVRWAVACTLGSKGNLGTAVDGLLRLAQDDDDDVRDWALFGLGSLSDVDDPRIREILLHATNDANADVRFEALVGLARRKDVRAVPGLKDELIAGNQSIELFDAVVALLGLSELPESWDARRYAEELQKHASSEPTTDTPP